MRISRRIAASAAALALIAGVGVAMSAPASASHNSQYTQSGNAVLKISPSFVALAKTAGVSFGVKGKYSTAKTVNGGRNITFPITGDPMDGAVMTKGKMTVAGTVGTMVFVNPIFGWATSSPTSRVQGSITGVLHQMRYPYSYLNGRSESLFDLTGVTQTVKWGKTQPLLGGATRPVTITTTSNVQMTQDVNMLDALDWTVAAPLFLSAEPIGTMTVKDTVLHSCSTVKECRNLSK